MPDLDLMPLTNSELGQVVDFLNLNMEKKICENWENFLSQRVIYLKKFRRSKICDRIQHITLESKYVLNGEGMDRALQKVITLGIKKSGLVSTNEKHEYTLWTSNSTSGLYPKEKCISTKRHVKIIITKYWNQPRYPQQ